MIVDKVYDYIVYSAGPAGIISSLVLTARRKSVLLLNYYGFTGGSMTESYNCLQNFKLHELEGRTRELVQKLANEKDGILAVINDGSVLNPEAVKMVLQEMIEQSGVDLLFHVVPVKIEEDINNINIQVSGKEGILNLKAKNIIDTSEDYSLMDLQKHKASPESLRYNLFLQSPGNEGWSDKKETDKILKLMDGRYWVSLKIPVPGDDRFIENRSHAVVNDLEKGIIEAGGRIQLSPPQTQRLYSRQSGGTTGKLLHASSLVSGSYSHDEIFIMCSGIEQALNKLI